MVIVEVAEITSSSNITESGQHITITQQEPLTGDKEQKSTITKGSKLCSHSQPMLRVRYQPFKPSRTSTGEMKDIHRYLRRLESARRKIAELENSGLALGFINHLEALGLSMGRVAKYANNVYVLLKRTGFNPSKATRKKVEDVVAWINTQPYKSTTKRGYKQAVRKLVQYAKNGGCDRKTPMPPEAAWISLKTDEKDSRVKPESLLTPEDFKTIVGAAENERDRALLNVLYEAALRPGELLTMKIGSVEFRENHCLISVNGKTGVKRIPLVISFKPLLEWLKKHPGRSNPEAPLWASLSKSAKGKGMSYPYFSMLVKRLAKKAGIKKDVWPYLFRHSCLTSLAKVFTESKLELYAGWVQGSKMARRYVHFSARDLEDAVLELHGLKQSKRTIGVPKLVDCPRCGRKNQPDSVRCSFCGYILDKKLALKMSEREREKTEKIIERIEKIEDIISSLLASQHSSQQVSSTQQVPLKPSQEPSFRQQPFQPHKPPKKATSQGFLKGNQPARQPPANHEKGRNV